MKNWKMVQVSFMALGDPHFKFQEFYLQRVEEMAEKFIQVCEERKPDFIVNLGDTLHDHRKIDVVAQCKAVQFMRKLKDIAPLIILIGNHDRINNSEFLTNISPFEACKDWSNTMVVDDKVQIFQHQSGLSFFFAPYVPPKKFQEALDASNIDPLQHCCGFTHQEFKGCKLGSMLSEEGDEWPHPIPLVCGHVHDQHKVNTFINYIGTPIGHSHGEHGKKTVSYFTCSDVELPHLSEWFWCKTMNFMGKPLWFYEEKIDLHLKKLKTLYMDAKEFLKFEPKIVDGVEEDIRYYRFQITGKEEDMKLVKRSEKFRELENKGCKIHFPIVKNKGNKEMDEEAKENVKRFYQKSFHEIVMEKLSHEERLEELRNIYEEILRE